MLRTKSLVVITALLSIGMMIVGISDVQAHPIADLYPHWWVDNSRGDLSVDWHFTSGFGGSAERARVRSGASQWNALGQSMEFVEGSQVGNFDYHTCPTSYQYDAVHYGSIDGEGGTVGQEWSCHYVSGNQEMYSTQVVFDLAEDWYTGTGDANDGFLNACIPSCQVDMWSIASHEWGHATGFTPHLDDVPGSTAECGNNSNQNTMCSTYYFGTERQRSLESHDIHTFNARY